MVAKNNKMEKVISKIATDIDFSGVVFMQDRDERVFYSAYGESNRAEEIKNKVDTRFGIASGCKLFTAIGICKLVEVGKLTFEAKVCDLLDADFPRFDRAITVHHLLTHSSGIPDYFDEAVMEDFEDLWKVNPMYLMKEPVDFLPMFQNQPMMFKPGEKFHYNNAGFILLGLIIEKVTGESFTHYIERNIFEPCEMQASGYFSLDQLPGNTAIGYIDNEDGTWRTNSYSIPIKGGADGGAYVTAPDMAKLWRALFSFKLLNKEMTMQMLTSHMHVNGEGYYGYGIWIHKNNGNVFKYHIMGYDPGVSFASAFYPETGNILVIPSNKESGPHKLMAAIEENIEKA